MNKRRIRFPRIILSTLVHFYNQITYREWVAIKKRQRIGIIRAQKNGLTNFFEKILANLEIERINTAT
jgi:hypothetical protein